MRLNSKACRHCVAWLLYVATACSASAVQSRGTPADPARVHVRAGMRHQGLGHGATSAEAARPAIVIFEDGQLKVAADNSDLSQILKVVAAKTGMAIEGSISSARVFGVYGPYSPRDVLTDLLTGSGYNFILTGNTPDGSPKQLLLTPQTGTSPVEALAPVTLGAGDTPPNSQGTAPVPEQPGTLAVGEGPPAASQDPQQRMQQRLERLEQMRNPMKPPSSPQ